MGRAGAFLSNPISMGSQLSGLLPPLSLDWAKIGPPKPTGNSLRDAVLRENYDDGALVFTIVSTAAPIAGEGLAESAALKRAGAMVEEISALKSELPLTLSPELGAEAPSSRFVGVYRNKAEGDAFRKAQEFKDAAGFVPDRGSFGAVGKKPFKWDQPFGNRSVGQPGMGPLGPPGRPPELPSELGPFREHYVLTPGQSGGGQLRMVTGAKGETFISWTHYGEAQPYIPIDPLEPLPRQSFLRVR
jgi:hypothetical protein